MTEPRDAYNGLLDRRSFLAVAGTLLAAASPSGRSAVSLDAGQTVPGAPFSAYGQPAAAEAGVARAIAANPAVPGNGVSWTPLQELDGIVTPSGLHFERHHNGVPRIDPAHHRLRISGAVTRPLEFDLETLLRYPRRSRLAFIECGGNSNAGWRQTPAQAPAGSMHGMVSCSEWTGVPLALLLDEAGVTADARWLIAEGADAVSMVVSLPLAKAREDCLLALFQNGERLRPEQGYPLRLLVPGWEGVLNCKWLKRLTLAAEPVLARNETARYTEPQPDGRARAFTFVMDVKSLLTSPSAGMRLAGHGVYELSGLAWSGRGRIREVEVSADGGESWRQAELADPVLPACLTRFRIPWAWSGQTAVLQSRATDETGARQPARAELLAARGDQGYFHYNAMVSWAVEASGDVSHAYVDAGPRPPSLDDLLLPRQP